MIFLKAGAHEKPCHGADVALDGYADALIQVSSYSNHDRYAQARDRSGSLSPINLYHYILIVPIQTRYRPPRPLDQVRNNKPFFFLECIIFGI